MAELHYSEAEADDAAKRRGVSLAFKRIFEDNADGRLVLDTLERRFAKTIWAKGGKSGERETTRRLGQFEVINFINAQLNLAINGGHDVGSS